MSNFRLAFVQLMEAETEFVQRPTDLGGPRKWGITVKDLATFRQKRTSGYDLMHMDENEAKDYYMKTFWKPLRLDEVRSEYVALIIFDQAICRGIQGALRACQRILGEQLESEMTKKLINCINSRQESAMGLELIKSYQRYLVDQCVQDPKQVTTLNSRLKRTHELLSFIVHQ